MISANHYLDQIYLRVMNKNIISIARHVFLNIDTITLARDSPKLYSSFKMHQSEKKLQKGCLIRLVRLILNRYNFNKGIKQEFERNIIF